MTDDVCAVDAEAPAMAGREPVYDVARLVAILCVVLIHSLTPLMDAETARLGVAGPIVLTSRMLRFSVPAFAMFTGALLWPRPFGGARSWSAFFRRRLSAVLAPFAAWSAIYLAAGLAVGVFKPMTSRELAVRFLLGTTWYHLYFIPIIIGIYLLTPLAVPTVRRRPWVAFAATVVFALTMEPLLGLVYFRPLPELESLVMRIARFVPYAGMGAWYAVRRAEWGATLRRWWPAALAAGMVMRVGQVYELVPVKWDGGGPLLDRLLVQHSVGATAYDTVLNLLCALALLGIADVSVRAWPGVAGFAAEWAPYAFGLYLAHPLAMGGLAYVGKAVGVDWPFPAWVMVLVVWPSVSVGVLAVVRWLARWPWLWWLTGVRAPSRTPAGPVTER